MKKFTFELEKVLEFRDFEKKQAEGELSKALAAEREIEDNLKLLAEQYATVKQQMKGSRSIEDVISQSQYNKLLEVQKEELLKQLTQAKMVTEEKRNVLKECMKKTTALEKMKEIQYEEYKEAVSKADKKRLEEIASIKSNADTMK